LEEGFIVEERV